MNDHLPISLSLFPGGRSKALTLSYDDGDMADRRLVETFNRFGLRASFHLNSSSLGRENMITPAEVAALYRGHEVSAHSVTHPFLEQLPPVAQIQEILEDRRRLEQMCGYPVRGMSYPFGTSSAEIRKLLPSLGIRYSRTATICRNFEMPEDFLFWHPTIHHQDDLLEYSRKFLAADNVNPRLKLFYIYGHSHEFRNNNTWELIEQFGELMGGHSDIWYATNIEIADYAQALRRLEFSADFLTALNPTAAELWITAGKTPVRLAPGSRTDLKTGDSVPLEFWKT